MNTDNLLLILVFIFAQNKQLMQDVKPVLDFLEEHKDAVSMLERMMSMQNAAKNSSATSPDEKIGEEKHETEHTKTDENTSEKEKTQSPLQGIANEIILKNIRSYLDDQATR